MGAVGGQDDFFKKIDFDHHAQDILKHCRKKVPSFFCAEKWRKPLFGLADLLNRDDCPHSNNRVESKSIGDQSVFENRKTSSASFIFD